MKRKSPGCRLTLLCGLTFVFLIYEYLSGQILSCLLNQPLSSFNTFKEINEHPKIKIYTHMKQISRFLILLSSKTGDATYKSIAERSIMMSQKISPDEMMQEISSGKAVAILQSQHTKEIIYMYQFLNLVQGRESYSDSDIVFFLPNPNGQYNKKIIKTIRWIKEACSWEYALERAQYGRYRINLATLHSFYPTMAQKTDNYYAKKEWKN